jgi:colanic acid/amylovoran biosynthesis glycosyltransferase
LEEIKIEKKIAMVLSGFPPATFILREITELIRRGVPIQIYTIRKELPSSTSAETKTLLSSTVSLLPLNIWGFVKAHMFFAFTKPTRYFGTLMFVLTRQFNSDKQWWGKSSRFRSDRLRSFIHFCEGVYLASMMRRDNDLRLIHAQYASHPTTLALVASRLLGVPYSFTGHAYDIWLDRLFLEDKIRDAEFVVTCSRFGKSEMLKGGLVENPEKIVTIYHGVDVNRFVPKANRTESDLFTILSVGRLIPNKLHKNLIHACKMLTERGHKFRCNIVGAGPLLSELQNLVNSLGIVDTVTLVGHVAFDKLPEFYQNADVFVLASEGDEGLPNVILESMATGVPVIATNVCGIAEAITNERIGILVEPNNLNELCLAIENLIANPEYRRELSIRSRQVVVEKFDQDVCLNELIDLYRLYGILDPA